MQNKAYKNDKEPQEQHQITRCPGCQIGNDQKEGAGYDQRHSYELFPKPHSSSGVINL